LAIEEELLDILFSKSLHIDEIARISTLKAHDVSARLTVMEIKSMVKKFRPRDI
jgi:hypothetical protein